MPKAMPAFSAQAHHALTALYQDLGQALSEVATRYPDIQCKSGCSLCCYASGSPLISALEWQNIRQHWPHIAPEVRQRILKQYASLKAVLAKRLQQSSNTIHEALYEIHCIFLLDGKCSIYTHRPLTCRAYGMTQQKRSDAPPWQDVFACNMEKDRWETVLRQTQAETELELPLWENYTERLKQIDATALITLLSYFDWEMRHAPLTD